jgi:hypothetical protein
MIALRLRRREPSFHDRRLAAHMAAAAPGHRWVHRGRLPRTWIAKLLHLVIGMALGAVGSAVVIAWLLAGCPS